MEAESKKFKNISEHVLFFDLEEKEMNILPGHSFTAVENVYIRGLISLGMLVEVAPVADTNKSDKPASTPK